jgi:hypothetical protein
MQERLPRVWGEGSRFRCSRHSSVSWNPFFRHPGKSRGPVQMGCGFAAFIYCGFPPPPARYFPCANKESIQRKSPRARGRCATPLAPRYAAGSRSRCILPRSRELAIHGFAPSGQPCSHRCFGTLRRGNPGAPPNRIGLTGCFTLHWLACYIGFLSTAIAQTERYAAVSASLNLFMMFGGLAKRNPNLGHSAEYASLFRPTRSLEINNIQNPVPSRTACDVLLSHV